MFTLPTDTGDGRALKVGEKNYTSTDLFFLNFRIAMSLSLCTGYRKSEISVGPDEQFDDNHLS